MKGNVSQILSCTILLNYKLYNALSIIGEMGLNSKKNYLIGNFYHRL